MHRVHPSPVGPLTLVLDDDGALTAVVLPGARHAPDPATWGERDDTAGAAVVTQLDEWFAGARTVFDLPTAVTGTPFQRRVWAALEAIPYGETATYGDLAAALGVPGAARAVGAAAGRNPLPVIVPCHRLVGSGGALTGYAGGLAVKAALLELESRTVAAAR
ncbi:MAG: methylated-DNA--[protein]-cysteine S-methyltransferase [Actinobacteria bacterium]|nr:methylated-DNA--[protein]-cysteine S-methyltransferase [Actinomycetota bacterium]